MPEHGQRPTLIASLRLPTHTILFAPYRPKCLCPLQALSAVRPCTTPFKSTTVYDAHAAYPVSLGQFSWDSSTRATLAVVSVHGSSTRIASSLTIHEAYATGSIHRRTSTDRSSNPSTRLLHNVILLHLTSSIRRRGPPHLQLCYYNHATYLLLLLCQSSSIHAAIGWL